MDDEYMADVIIWNRSQSTGGYKFQDKCWHLPNCNDLPFLSCSIVIIPAAGRYLHLTYHIYPCWPLLDMPLTQLLHHARPWISYEKQHTCTWISFQSINHIWDTTDQYDWSIKPQYNKWCEMRIIVMLCQLTSINWQQSYGWWSSWYNTFDCILLYDALIH